MTKTWVCMNREPNSPLNTRIVYVPRRSGYARRCHARPRSRLDPLYLSRPEVTRVTPNNRIPWYQVSLGEIIGKVAEASEGENIPMHVLSTPLSSSHNIASYQDWTQPWRQEKSPDYPKGEILVCVSLTPRYRQLIAGFRFTDELANHAMHVFYVMVRYKLRYTDIGPPSGI